MIDKEETIKLRESAVVLHTFSIQLKKMEKAFQKLIKATEDLRQELDRYTKEEK